ncbi:hypothetical protein N7462_010265 [Penicillium macrosclerotiorum]|uniref:uncharacterized protein n=1 Tax=Penicillium macrosclerotiorum TaxID=303699 RepID=UPI002546E850|nr:uncharacterized protein N7462_010265 [Penicillium macrosclerotiorum]KAJ5669195.1 hypothetical protein N7462_010265 [Penicillium macrosclerotiorum]
MPNDPARQHGTEDGGRNDCSNREAARKYIATSREPCDGPAMARMRARIVASGQFGPHEHEPRRLLPLLGPSCGEAVHDHEWCVPHPSSDRKPVDPPPSRVSAS